MRYEYRIIVGTLQFGDPPPRTLREAKWRYRIALRKFGALARLYRWPRPGRRYLGNCPHVPVDAQQGTLLPDNSVSWKCGCCLSDHNHQLSWMKGVLS